MLAHSYARLTNTEPDLRIRRRAHALLLAMEGQTLESVARLSHTSAYRIYLWQERFAREGRVQGCWIVRVADGRTR